MAWISDTVNLNIIAEYEIIIAQHRLTTHLPPLISSQMTDAMFMISSFIQRECDPNAGFDPQTQHQSKALFKAQNLVKSRLGRAGPGPLAEALEVVDSLPCGERLESSLAIIQSMRHLFFHDGHSDTENERDSE